MNAILVGSSNALNMARMRMRRRHTIEEEIVIDYNKPLNQIEYTILQALTSTDLTIGQLVNYLKHFCRYCLKRFDEKDPKVVSDKLYQVGLLADIEILFCLRVILFHDSAEVRAQTLRAFRYFVRTKECGKTLLRLNIHQLIVRSLDFMVKNQFERLQALRLIRHLMTFDTEAIPIIFGRCLCAIVSDNLNEKDALVKPCMATIAELTLINPLVSYKTGCIRALVNCAVSVVLGCNFTPNTVNDNRQQKSTNHNDFIGIATSGKLTSIELSTSNIVLLEAILSAFLNLFNWPETRRFVLPNSKDFNVFIAPFTDTYSFLQASIASKNKQMNCGPGIDNKLRDNRPDPKNIFYQPGGGAGANRPVGNAACSFDERMLRYSACKYCLLSILRSWPGMFFMCRIIVEHFNDELNQAEHRARTNSNMPFSEADYSEIYNQTNLIPLRSLQDSLKFFGIEGRLMPRKVTQMVSGVGKAINSNSHQTSSFFTATSYESMSPIESLISILHLPYPEVHKHLLELIFELFGLRLPKWQEKFEDCMHYVYFALLSKTVKHQTISSQKSKDFYPNEWQLYDGFVAKEAEHILPAKPANRLNFVIAYHALLLQSMVEYGLIEALVSVVLDSDDICCVNLATILIGELIHLSGKYLPASTYAHRCQSLPSLVAASVSNHKSRRSRALTAISNLNQIHELKKKNCQPASLFLDQQILFCKFSNVNVPLRNHSASFNKTHDEMILNMIKSSSVTKKINFKEWNWETIADILRHPGEALKRLEDKEMHRSFVRRLLDFYKPSCRNFSNIARTAGSSQLSDTLLYPSKDKKEPIYLENPRQIGIVATLFVDFLFICDEIKIYEFIEEFILDLDNCIKAITKPIPDRIDQVLISSRMQSTLSRYYFLLLGRCTHTSVGRSWLERTHIHQYIIDLISLNHRTSEVYLKLLVSSLDYNDIKFSQAILRKILTCASETVRLYSTQFLRVLLRAEVSNFSDWAIELLLFQLYDSNSSVALVALDILDEACAGDATCLLKLIAQRPSVLHLGDAGIVFMARFASIPAGLIHFRQSNMLDNELTRWKKTFCARYVRLAEDSLNEIFSLHQRSEMGSYGRRSDRDREGLWPNLKRVSMILYAMPHLYGQLSNTPEGVEILKREKILEDLLHSIQKKMHYFIEKPNNKIVSNFKKPNEAEILKLKAAIWSIGHIMSAEEGARFVLETKKQVLRWIATLAKSSLIVSLRSTCFLALCLISSTKRGSNSLRKCGWVPIEHSPEDIFPINQQEYDDFYYGGRPRFMSDPEKMSDSQESLMASNESAEDEDDTKETLENLKNATDDSSSLLSIKKKDKLGSKNEMGKRSTVSSLNSVTTIDSNTSSLGCLETIPPLSNSNSRNRPRSSSDCVATIKDDNSKKTGEIITNSKKIIHLLSSDSVDDRNRKISAPCVTLTADLIKEGRSDSNESANTNNTAFYSSGIESRSTSFADFSTSSCASNTLEADKKSSNTLLPTASPKSRLISNYEPQDNLIDLKILNENFNKSELIKPEKKKKRGLQISNTPFLADDPYPSPMDAHGYAQLRAIQKQRVQSLSGNMFFTGVTTPIEHYTERLSTGAKSPTKTSRDNLFDIIVPDITYNSRQRKISSALVQPGMSFDSKGGYNLINGSIESDDSEVIIPRRFFKRTGSHISKRSNESSAPVIEDFVIDIQNKIDRSSEIGRSFLCLALPENLSNIFYLVEDNDKVDYNFKEDDTKKPSSSNKLDIDKLNRNLLQNEGLEYHRKANCLLCCYLPKYATRDEIHRTTETLKSADQTSSSIDTKLTPSSSPALSQFNLTNSEMSLILQRKEAIRLVISLSASMTAKSTEQGLLNLKQKFPSLFEDFCLYSEVCLIMETCHYRASARRFLHELFLDVSPIIFYKRAQQILAHNKPIIN